MSSFPESTRVRLALFLAGLAVALLAGDVGPASDDYFLFLGIRGASPSWLLDGAIPPERWGFFRPLGLWELYLYVRWFGFHPGWLRAGHAFLHGLATALTGELAGRLGASPARRFFIGLLFCVHPGIVQAVGLLSCRFDLWATVLCLASVAAYDRALAPGSRGALALSSGAFLLALGFKECAVVLPVCLLCWGLARGTDRARFLGPVPHAMIAAGYLLGRAQLLGWGGAYGAPSMAPTPAQIGRGWAGALAALAAWPVPAVSQVLLGAAVFGLLAAGAVLCRQWRAATAALCLGLLALLPAVALLARCADDIAGRLMYSAWPWFAICVGLMLPPITRALPVRLAAGLGAVLLLATAQSRLDACRLAGRVVRELGHRAVRVAAASPVPLIIALDKTPGTLDGAFLFPGGLNLVSSALALVDGTPAPLICEKDWPLNAPALMNQDQLFYITLDHCDGVPGRMPRLPAPRPSKPLHLKPVSAPATFDSPPLALPADRPVTLTFSARALLVPQAGRTAPLAWGEVLTRRTAAPTYLPRERSLFVLVADGRWRTYHVVLDPEVGRPGFDYDRYFHPGVSKKELSQLQGIRLNVMNSPGRVWIRDAKI